MQLRRIFIAYAVTLAVCLLFLADQATPQSAREGGRDGRRVQILAQPDDDKPPAKVTVATPKGRRAVEPLNLGHYDIPLTALTAYQRAADILVEVKPSCGLRWTLLAAIGRVESDHGRYAGAKLGSDGVSEPQVVGVALDGEGPVATIRDTDAGRLDNDPEWDHAVGPMQFIPSTWDVVGVDGDGDGVRSVDDIDDAALAAGVYLCAGAESLETREAMETALYRYNDSAPYVALVLAYEEKYSGGDFVVTAPDGGVAEASASLVSHPLAGRPIKADNPAEARLKARIKADARKAVAAAKKTGGKTEGISGTKPETTRQEPGGGASDGGSPSGKASAEASASSDAKASDGADATSPTPADSPNAEASEPPGGDSSSSPGSDSTEGGASGSPTPSETSPSESTGSDPTPSAPADEPSCTTSPEPSSDATPTEPTSPGTCAEQSTEVKETCVDPCEPTPSP